jgi:nitroreductase
MDVFETIRTRRSVRSYLNQSVEEEKLDQIFKAAGLAPSANNRQEWRFIVVRDQETRHLLSIAADGQGFVAEAPVVIAGCAEESHHVMSCGQPAYAIDVAIALDHMTLAAAALGLGTCWIGAFSEDRVREILDVPKSVRVVGLLTIGYPKSVPGPSKRKPMNETVFHEKWLTKQSGIR